jgi:hypothetical protein
VFSVKRSPRAIKHLLMKKRRSSTALHNVAEMPSSLRACVLESGGDPPLLICRSQLQLPDAPSIVDGLSAGSLGRGNDFFEARIAA